MANYSVLKAAVEAVVKTNGNEEITGANLQSTLESIIDSLGAGYQFVGVATTSTSPGTPDENVFYIAPAGTYENFGTSYTVKAGFLGVFRYNGSWSKSMVEIFNAIQNGVLNVNLLDGYNYLSTFTLAEAVVAVPSDLRYAAKGIAFRNSTGGTTLAFFNNSAYSSGWTTLSNWVVYDQPVSNLYFTEKGQRVGKTGWLQTDASREASMFIPVKAGNVMDVSVYYSTNNISACYVYDAAFNALGEYVFTGQSGQFAAILAMDDVITQYSTAAYVRFSSNLNKGYILSNDVSLVKTILSLSPQYNSVGAKYMFVYTGRIDKNGQFVSFNGYEATDFVPLISDGTYRVRVYYGPTAISACYAYDENCQPLGEYIFTGQSGSFTATLIASDVISQYPTARYVRLTATAGDGYVNYIGVNEIYRGLSVLRDSTTKLQEKMDGLDSVMIEQAAEYDALNSYRERQLRQEYMDKVEDGYVGKWYGVEWTEGDNPDNVTAIYSTGDSSLHTTLPIQNKMRRCVTKDNIVQYYLNASNSELKADGTSAVLDGTDGNVMVEIPEFFYKVEDETSDNTRTIRIKISEDAFPDFIFSPKRYTSAYEATIDRTSGYLASVCTTYFTRQTSEEVKTESGNFIQGTAVSRGTQKTARRNGHSSNASDYRGGTNNSTYDEYEDPTDADFSRNQLGLPVANMNRKKIREACADHQFGYLYDTQRVLYMLIQVEFKTRNIQKSISNGGLGYGATQYPSYNAYESFFKPQGGISVLPCGITNALGNSSGEVYYLMENVPISQSGSGSEITYTFGNVWMPCMSYRGVEHYYGHMYKIADQVDCMTGETTGYVDGHEDDSYWSLHDVTWWYEKNPYLAKLIISSDKNLLGTWNFPCHIMTVSSLMMGKNGHVLHIGATGKDYTKYYCDCSELDSKTGQKKYITFNGRIVSSTLVGNHFIVAYNTINGGDSRPSDGTRLDHF